MKRRGGDPGGDLDESPTAEVASGSSSESSPASSSSLDARGRSTASGPTETGGSGTGSSGFATLGRTPRETLRGQEVARSRFFVGVALGFSVVTSVALLFLGGDRLAKALLLFGLGVCGASFVWLGITLRDAARYSVRRMSVAGYATIFAVFCGVYYFGVFSPAAVIVPVGIYFFGMSQGAGATLAVYLTCSAAYLLLAGSATLHVLPDLGIQTGERLAVRDRFVMIALVEATFLMTYLLARSTHRATEDAIDQHDRAVRGLAKREALLDEARHDLERALVAGGMGRFTEQVIGSFRLGGVIGRGGMGEVYEARHVQDGSVAAVKMLHAHLLPEADSVRRFMREARIAASLQVPHVVRVVEIGDFESALPYIAMERLRGHTLSDYLRHHTRLSMKSVITLVRQVGAALDAAREAGVVHRDIKPRNLFLAESETGPKLWKVLDFGISKLLDFEQTVNPGKVVGTPAYMAPEQAARGEVSHRTDLFALAVVCYRALTGRPAFTGEGMVDTVYQIVHVMPPQPSELTRMHDDVDLVLAIGLAKDPSRRFESAAEMADALESAAHGKLDDTLRLRGQLLLARHPWGHDASAGQDRGAAVRRARHDTRRERRR